LYSRTAANYRRLPQLFARVAVRFSPASLYEVATRLLAARTGSPHVMLVVMAYCLEQLD
jgi:hypothetical protein